MGHRMDFVELNLASVTLLVAKSHLERRRLFRLLCFNNRVQLIKTTVTL
jgi:hypothetical protein